MPKIPRYDLLSVGEVADRLEITERQVWNLIKTAKLSSEKISGRTWVSLVHLNRYKLIHRDPFLDHVFSGFPSEYAGSAFRRVYNFGGRRESSDALPGFELAVSLEDWWRFTRPFEDRCEYEAIRAEVRGRLNPEAPEHFSVQFKIDQEALEQTLSGVIKGVRAPEIPLYDKQELEDRAMKHLLECALPKLGQPREDRIEDPIAYLKTAVRNFYTDMARKPPEEIAFGGPEEEEIAEAKVAFREWEENKDTPSVIYGTAGLEHRYTKRVRVSTPKESCMACPFCKIAFWATPKPGDDKVECPFCHKTFPVEAVIIEQARKLSGKKPRLKPE